LPIIFREDSTASQSLYVQNTWPATGGLGFVRGAGRGHPWGQVVYRADDVLAADFSEMDGLYSWGFFGCVGLTYIYPDNDGGFAGAVLYHVPSASLSGIKGAHGMHGPCHPPRQYQEILDRRGGAVNNVWVVFSMAPENPEGIIKEYCQFFTKDGVTDQRIKIIINHSQGFTFGVRYDGAVGPCTGAPRTVSVAETREDNAKSSCCYVSTAACQARGLPDDCRELQALRWFRDQVLRRQPGGPQLIERYYRTAPAIVSAIDALPNRRSIYDWIYQSYVDPAVAAIERGEMTRARTLVEGGIAQIEAQFRPCQTVPSLLA